MGNLKEGMGRNKLEKAWRIGLLKRDTAFDSADA
jgi:hypothetical protein